MTGEPQVEEITVCLEIVMLSKLIFKVFRVIFVHDVSQMFSIN